MPREALIVFAKLPVPGQVKTRLTEKLSDAEAANLYDAFLRDALDQYVLLDADVRLYLAPAPEAIPPDLVPEPAVVRLQEGRDLGSRMLHAFLETFAAGYDRIVIVGTDHPTLPTSFIEEAFEALAEPRSVCIGPSDDGGYYLLGMNECYPQLFTGMTYSHAAVFDQTLVRARATGAPLTVLPPWYDVDTPPALRRLAAELDDAVVALPRTRTILANLLERHPWIAAPGDS